MCIITAEGGERSTPSYSPRFESWPLLSRNRSPLRFAASRDSVSPLVKAAMTTPTCLELFRGGAEDTPLSLVNTAPRPPRFLSRVRSGPGQSVLQIAHITPQPVPRPDVGTVPFAGVCFLLFLEPSSFSAWMAASLFAEAEVALVKIPGCFRHLSQELESSDQAGTFARVWDGARTVWPPQG